MSELDEWQAWVRPQMAAVSEGYCPEHLAPLTPVSCAAGWSGGHCPRCHAYWGVSPSPGIRWTLDHHPGTLRPVTPEWVL